MYYAFQHLEDGDRFVEVKGRQVRFEGFEDFEFFSYKSNTCGYCIVEAQTGMSAGMKDKLKDAKELAQRNLNGMGPEKLREVVEDQIRDHGLSPKYKEV